MARACISSGYRYEFAGKRRWRSSSSELWEIAVGKVVCGREIGRRRVDGSEVVVVKVRSKYFAALPHAVRRR